MFCTGCGQKLPDDSVKCPKCNRLTKPLTPSSVLAGGTTIPAGKTAAPQASRPAQPAKTGNSKPAPPPVKKGASQPQGSGRTPQPAPPQPPPVNNGPPPEPVFSPLEHDAGILFGRAFSHLFKDNDWLRKSLILNTLTITIPVLNFFAAGYFVQHARKVSNGIDLPLPEIDFGSQWKSGLMYSLAFIVMSLMGGAITAILGVFTQLPMISVLAAPLLALFSLIFIMYFVGASTIAIIEGNPWMILNFPVCTQIIMENLVDVVLTTIVISLVSMLLCPFIITGGLACIISCHLIGQLGRIFRTRSKFL